MPTTSNSKRNKYSFYNRMILQDIKPAPLYYHEYPEEPVIDKNDTEAASGEKNAFVQR